MAGEKTNNSGGILGLLGLTAVIASWFFVFVRVALLNVVPWEWFLRFWQTSPRFDTWSTWALLAMFLVPVLLALIAVPAFLRSSYFQARIPAILAGILLLGTLVYRLFPIAENDFQRNVIRFFTDIGVVEVGLGFFLFLGGSLLILVSGLRAKG